MHNVNEMLNKFQISKKHLGIFKKYKEILINEIPNFIEDFYDWLPVLPEYSKFFYNNNMVNKVKLRQTAYWEELFSCEINEDYINSRFKIGEVHANISLPLDSYLASTSFVLSWWINFINTNDNIEKEDIIILEKKINKLVLFDTSLIASSYEINTNRIIEEQSRTLMELSTPTIQLWDEILVLPILGVLDSQRAQDMTKVMLYKIQETQAKAIIVDVTGVPGIDLTVAGHLVKITKATKIMGCQCILSGIGPEVAQTLVYLGVNLDNIRTSFSLSSAFKEVLTSLNYKVKKIDD